VTDNFASHCQYVLTTVSPHFWRLAGLTILSVLPVLLAGLTILPVRFAKKTVLVLVFLSVLPVLLAGLTKLSVLPVILAKFTRTDKIASP